MEPVSKKTDEIDLVHYFNLLLHGLRKLKDALVSYLFFLFRNKILLIIIFAALALLSFLSKYIIPRYYQTDAVFVSHNMTSDLYLVMLDDLNKLARAGKNSKTLSRHLNISTGEAASIRSVASSSLSKLDFTYKNDTTSIAGFNITLVLKDISSLPRIQQGIKDYLERNEYGSRRRAARRKLLELRKFNLQQQNAALDSLKEVMNARMLPKSQFRTLLIEEPVMPVLQLYKIQQDNLREQTGLEQELTLMENVEIVQPFTKIDDYNLPDMKRILLMSLVIAFVLSLVLTTILGKK
jgi:hypothetical protein